MDNTITELNVDSEDIYTSNKNKCVMNEYSIDEYKKVCSYIFI